MSNNTSSQSVWRVREQLRPSDPLRNTLSNFLPKELSGVDIPFYTQAERFITAEAFQGPDYEVSVELAKKRLKALGGRTLALAANVIIRPDKAGVTFQFEVARSSRRTFVKMTAALDIIVEEGTPPRSGLYVRLARTCLTRNVKQRQQAVDTLVSNLRDPTRARQMYVNDPQIVPMHIPIPEEMG